MGSDSQRPFPPADDPGRGAHEKDERGLNEELAGEGPIDAGDDRFRGRVRNLTL